MFDRCLSSVISTTPVLVIIGILVLILLAILRICWYRTVISPARPPPTAPRDMASPGDGSSSAPAGGGSLRNGIVEDTADRMIVVMDQQIAVFDRALERTMMLSVFDRALKRRDDYIKWLIEQNNIKTETIEAQKAWIERQDATIASIRAEIEGLQDHVANLREDR